MAGPGFVNFRLDDGWLHDALAAVLVEGEEGYARPDVGHGEKVQVEFISANPTGPIHVGNGWWGSYGDALARVLARSGHVVSREYYVNDTGGQIRTLGRSLLARHRGEEVPEGGYQGEYVTDLAADYDGPDDVTVAGRWAADRILERIRATLASVGIVFDEWYTQASIEESGAVDETIALLDAKGLVFEEDGATWFRATELGDTRDRVLRKANGDATYLAGDLAYHRDKFLVRGFDRVIDVFGADHHGQVASLMAGVEALGVDPSRLEVKLGQMVSLVDGDESVKMGKRAGNAIDLDTVVADIGPDATRILSLMSTLDQAATFDLAQVREQSADNPVFYVQMASARIGGVGRKAAERGSCAGPALRGRPVAAHPSPRARAAALPRGAARGGGRRRRRPRPDQGDHLGPTPGLVLPRLLPRLPDPGRRRRPGTGPGPAVAGRGDPDRPGHRTGPARRVRARGDVSMAVPTGPVDTDLLPADRGASAPTAGCPSAAATSSSWPRPTAPRCSSTTRPTCAPPAARR